MNVIGGAADCKGFDLEIICGAEQVSPESFLQFHWNRIRSILRAKDAMHEIRAVCMGQGVVLWTRQLAPPDTRHLRAGLMNSAPFGD